MSSGVFVRTRIGEYRVSSGETHPRDKCSKFMRKNEDIIWIAVSIIFAIFSTLAAYGHIPMFAHPMFVAGCLATVAIFAFGVGIMRALLNRECIIVRKNDDPNTNV